MIDGLYRPSEWQTRFHQLTTDEALGAGAAGPGKTACLIADPLQALMVDVARVARRPELAALPDTELWDLIAQNPLRQGWSTGWVLYLRRTSPMLLDTMAKAGRLFKAIDPEVKFNHDALMYTFKCGFRYQFGHCQHVKDYERYMSSEYIQVNFDELVQFENEQYEQVKTRVRSVDPVLARFEKVRAMSNPVMNEEQAITVQDPQWVRTYFVDPAPLGGQIIEESAEEDGEVFTVSRVYLPAKLDDNPDKQYVARYKRRLATTKLPHIREALLKGNWYIVQGAFFSAIWDPRIHVIHRFNIPVSWPIFRSCDWGFKTLGVILWFVMDEDDNLIVIHEIDFQMQTVEQVAERVKTFEKKMKLWDDDHDRSLITGPADTQLWETRGESAALSKAEEFALKGIAWVQADKSPGSRARHAGRVAARLMDHEDGTVDPGLAFFSHCLGCIRTIPTIGTSKENIEEPAKGGLDHYYDAAAYGVAYASHGRAGVGQVTKPKKKSRVDRRARGQYGYGQH